MVFEVDKLEFSYVKGKKLFSDVSLALSDGDILSVLGVNGVGKTSLIKCFLQANAGYSGRIMVDGIDMADISLRERAKIIGYVMLNDSIDSEMTVSEYICLGMAAEINYFSSPKREHYEKAYELCAGYDVQHLFNRNLSTLSQGEGQLINIMRVLMQNPKIIVFDEPTATLDLKNQRKLLQLIKQFSESGKIIIQITHNPNHALMLGGKVLLMNSEGNKFGDISIIKNKDVLSDLYGVPLRMLSEENVNYISFDL